MFFIGGWGDSLNGFQLLLEFVCWKFVNLCLGKQWEFSDIHYFCSSWRYPFSESFGRDVKRKAWLQINNWLTGGKTAHVKKKG